MSASAMPLSPGATSGVSNNAKLFIGGLSYETTEESLLRYFSTFGQVSSAVVLREPDSKRSRGFGFVTFTRPECAKLALSQQHHTIDNRRVEAKFAEPKKKNDTTTSTTNMAAAEDVAAAPPAAAAAAALPIMMMTTQQQSSARATPINLIASTRSSPQLFSPNTTATSTTAATGQSGDSTTPPPSDEVVPRKVFVGGLKYSTTDEILREYFSQYGVIESTQIPFNRDTRKSRGFGYVVFRDQGPVEQVLLRQKASPHFIEGKQVEIKACTPRQITADSAGGSPRNVPQTPIMPPRSDSYSSLTSSASAQQRPAGVSATPVRPSSAAMLSNSLPPPPAIMQPPLQMSRDHWGGLTSPVTYEDMPSSERRSSFASVRSTSPYAPSSYAAVGAGMVDPQQQRGMSVTPMYGMPDYAHALRPDLLHQQQQHLHQQQFQQQQQQAIRVDGAPIRVEGSRFQSFQVGPHEMMQQQQQAPPQHYEDPRWRAQQQQQAMYGFEMGRKQFDGGMRQQQYAMPQHNTSTAEMQSDAGLFTLASFMKGLDQPQQPAAHLQSQAPSRFHPVAPRGAEMLPGGMGEQHLQQQQQAFDLNQIVSLLNEAGGSGSSINKLGGETTASAMRRPVQEGASSSLPPINFRPLAAPPLATTSPARAAIARSPLFDQSAGSAFAPALPGSTPGSIW